MATVFTDDTFEQEIKNYKGVVLVDFFATWCGPCQMIAPVIDEFAESYKDKAKVGKVDVDASPDLASKFGVMSIPTIIVFKDGEVVDKNVGAADKAKLEEMVDKALS